MCCVQSLALQARVSVPMYVRLFQGWTEPGVDGKEKGLARAQGWSLGAGSSQEFYI